jgi:hypothetical protein
MDDQWAVRIEAKIDKLTEAVTTQKVEGGALQATVGVLESTVGKLKTKQDKQEGATAFIGFLAVSGLLAVLATEIMRHWK